jgi:NTP pyrophosphatase (non-canonical NTP hydrolase)
VTGSGAVPARGATPRSSAWLAARAFLGRLAAEDRELPPWFHPAKLGEEAGEAWSAWAALHGWSRHPPEPGELDDELADVVITAYIVAAVEGIDLEAAIQAKGAELLARELGELGRG